MTIDYVYTREWYVLAYRVFVLQKKMCTLQELSIISSIVVIVGGVLYSFIQFGTHARLVDKAHSAEPRSSLDGWGRGWSRKKGGGAKRHAQNVWQVFASLLSVGSV